MTLFSFDLSLVWQLSSCCLSLNGCTVVFLPSVTLCVVSHVILLPPCPTRAPRWLNGVFRWVSGVVPTPAHCKRKSSFAVHDVVSNSAIIRLSPLPSSFPSPLPLSCGSIHILITAFPSPALRHSIRALPASGFALLLPPLCDHSLFSEAHQK